MCSFRLQLRSKFLRSHTRAKACVANILVVHMKICCHMKIAWQSLHKNELTDRNGGMRSLLSIGGMNFSCNRYKCQSRSIPWWSQEHFATAAPPKSHFINNGSKRIRKLLNTHLLSSTYHPNEWNSSRRTSKSVRQKITSGNGRIETTNVSCRPNQENNLRTLLFASFAKGYCKVFIIVNDASI